MNNACILEWDGEKPSCNTDFELKYVPAVQYSIPGLIKELDYCAKLFDNRNLSGF